MGEAEWLAAGDPIPMLDFLGGGNPLRPECPAPPPSPRKLRLFAAACTLLLPRRTPGLRRAVEAALAFADGETGAPELEAARWDHPPGPWTVCNPDAGEAAYYVVRDYSLTGRRAEMAALLREVLGNPSRPAELRHLGNALCRRCNGAGTRPDVYPPKPCPACSCITPAALAVGRRAYDERDFAALPILADALEEAGCLEEDVLMHLRGWERCPQCLGTLHCHHPVASQSVQQCTFCWDDKAAGGYGWPVGRIPLRGPHVRGCWALDVVLGKS